MVALGRADRGGVAVVGAGPGGLATAMLLSASGLRVTVFEAGPTIGGRTSRVQSGPYVFDRGPTFFLMPYVLEEIFAAGGRRLSDYADLTRLDPMYRLLIGRRGDAPICIDATQDVAEMSRRIAQIEAADGPQFERFIRDNREKLRLMEPILRASITSPLDLVNAGTMKMLPHLHPHLSVADLLKRYFKNPAVRLAVSFQSKYLGMSPMDCPSLFTILPFIEYEYGIWHPRGGCSALMDGMAEACREMGVDIRLGEPVTSLEFDGRRVTGLRTRASERPQAFDRVVINADAAWALKHLIPAGLRPSADQDAKVDARRYSCSTYMLYLGVEGEVDHLPHHTIYISGGYEQNLEDITTLGRVSDDPSVYVCNPSRIDPTLAPRGHSSLYVLMPTPNTRTSDGKVAWDPSSGEGRAIRERVLDQLEQRFEIRDIRSRIRAEHVTTPDDWRRGADGIGAINHGATFNMAHNLGQMLHKRVQHRYPGVEGLYFCGGGTHPGSGLPVIFLSAQTVARLLCADVRTAYAGDRVPEVQHSAEPVVV